MKYAAPLLGTVGVVLFGMLRLAYVFFYQQLRATPQEVGYGYQDILAGQLVGTIELTLVLTGVLVAGKLLTRAVRHASAGRWGEATALPHPHDLRRLAQRSGITVLVFILLALPIFAYLFGKKATDYGETVRNAYLFSPALQLLAIQASPAKVSWTIPRQPGMIDLGSLNCLLYLGYANGIAVFYNVENHDSLRLPTNQIQMTLPKVEKVAHACL
ncbi:hypothetical protein GCM10010172_02140 [Paractinoplanes ferrugineus]|uniref:Uncharacterized protein n=1 Tax=Paractinoplanes ferrugineus TaxID=113564 RepID=A0A919JBF1_9ACTN|nr:hypothetical protein [Actinoplanes ferrugineus]GIE14061.1 hypothetical protein Afe05nite_59010 [Actinoplanes ferrugineus]